MTSWPTRSDKRLWTNKISKHVQVKRVPDLPTRPVKCVSLLRFHFTLNLTLKLLERHSHIQFKEDVNVTLFMQNNSTIIRNYASIHKSVLRDRASDPVACNTQSNSIFEYIFQEISQLTYK